MPKDIAIIGIFGRNNELGEGKTIFLTFKALKEHKEYPNRQIYADYKLPFSKPINHVIEISDIHNSSIYLDDITAFFDCRESGKGNFNETWFLFQLRKNQNNFFYTAQIEGSVEGRLRRISNMIIQTEQIKYPLFHIYFCTKNGTVLEHYDINYKKDVTDIYDTLEIVKRRVSLKELIDLSEEYNTKVAFRQITKLQFSFKQSVADTVLLCLQHNSIDNMNRVLIPLGYALTK